MDGKGAVALQPLQRPKQMIPQPERGPAKPLHEAFSATAFSLPVYTGQPIPTRLFLKKSRTSPHSPVQSRSENALETYLSVGCSLNCSAILCCDSMEMRSS